MNESAVVNEKMTKELWLNYFNNYLHSQHLISDDEYNKMILKIANECK